MNSKYLRICCLVLAVFVIQISCKSLSEVEILQPPKETEVSVPESAAPPAVPAKEKEVEIPAVVAPQPATTRRPGIVLGIWNGIVRAPAEIANRVQGIIAGINNRRQNATTAAPRAEDSSAEKVIEEVVLVN